MKTSSCTPVIYLTMPSYECFHMDGLKRKKVLVHRVKLLVAEKGKKLNDCPLTVPYSKRDHEIK